MSLFLDFFFFSRWHFCKINTTLFLNTYHTASPPLPMFTCQLKYIFSISFLSQTFQKGFFSASPFPVFPSLIFLLTRRHAFSHPPSHLNSDLVYILPTFADKNNLFIWASQKGVKCQIPSSVFFKIYLELLGSSVHYGQTTVAFFFFYNFILPCHQAPTETTVICFGKRPTKISFRRMATAAGLLLDGISHLVQEGVWHQISKFAFNPIWYRLNNASVVQHKARTVNWAAEGFVCLHVGLMRQWCCCDGGMETGDRSNSWESPFSF